MLLSILRDRRFVVIGVLEIIERLAWYSFYFTVAYFYINSLGFSEKEAMLLKGAVAAMLYAGNAVGGIIADRLLGVKRSLFLSILLLAVGYCLVGLMATNLMFVICGMAILTIGGFLFKPQPLNLLVGIFKSHDERDSAVTMYYQFVNIGSLLAASFAPPLVTYYGYKVTYGLVGIAMFSALVVLFLSRKIYVNYDNLASQNKLAVKDYLKITAILGAIFLFLMFVFSKPIYAFILLILCAVLLVAYLIYEANKLELKIARYKTMSIIPMLFLGVIFFVIYEQMDSSALLFTLHHVDTNLFGYKMDSQSVSGTLNSIGIIVLAPIMAGLYFTGFGKKLTIQHKFIIGLLICSLTIGTLYVATLTVNPADKVSIFWLVLAITIFFSAGELLVSALGAAALASLAPLHLRGFAIGLWFLASALGIKIGAWLSSLVANGKHLGGLAVLNLAEKIESFYAYQKLYALLFIVCIILTIIGALIAFGMERKVKKISLTEENISSVTN